MSNDCLERNSKAGIELNPEASASGSAFKKNRASAQAKKAEGNAVVGRNIKDTIKELNQGPRTSAATRKKDEINKNSQTKLAMKVVKIKKTGAERAKESDPKAATCGTPYAQPLVTEKGKKPGVTETTAETKNQPSWATNNKSKDSKKDTTHTPVNLPNKSLKKKTKKLIASLDPDSLTSTENDITLKTLSKTNKNTIGEDVFHQGLDNFSSFSVATNYIETEPKVTFLECDKNSFDNSDELSSWNAHMADMELFHFESQMKDCAQKMQISENQASSILDDDNGEFSEEFRFYLKQSSKAVRHPSPTELSCKLAKPMSEEIVKELDVDTLLESSKENTKNSNEDKISLYFDDILDEEIGCTSIFDDIFDNEKQAELQRDDGFKFSDSPNQGKIKSWFEEVAREEKEATDKLKTLKMTEKSTDNEIKEPILKKNKRKISPNSGGDSSSRGTSILDDIYDKENNPFTSDTMETETENVFLDNIPKDNVCDISEIGIMLSEQEAQDRRHYEQHFSKLSQNKIEESYGDSSKCVNDIAEEYSCVEESADAVFRKTFNETEEEPTENISDALHDEIVLDNFVHEKDTDLDRPKNVVPEILTVEEKLNQKLLSSQMEVTVEVDRSINRYDENTNDKRAGTFDALSKMNTKEETLQSKEHEDKVDSVLKDILDEKNNVLIERYPDDTLESTTESLIPSSKNAGIAKDDTDFDKSFSINDKTHGYNNKYFTDTETLNEQPCCWDEINLDSISTYIPEEGEEESPISDHFFEEDDPKQDDVSTGHNNKDGNQDTRMEATMPRLFQARTKKYNINSDNADVISYNILEKESDESPIVENRFVHPEECHYQDDETSGTEQDYIDLENSCSLSDTTSENNITDIEEFDDSSNMETENPEEKKLSLDEVNLDVDRADDFISSDMLKTRNEERAILESYFNDEQPISNDNYTKYHNQYDSQDVRIKAVTPQLKHIEVALGSINLNSSSNGNEKIFDAAYSVECQEDDTSGTEQDYIDLENSCSLSDTTSEKNSTDFEECDDARRTETENLEEKKLSLDEVNLDVDRADDFISNDILEARKEERAILESYFNDEQPISNDNSTQYYNQYDSQEVRIRAVTPQLKHIEVALGNINLNSSSNDNDKIFDAAHSAECPDDETSGTEQDYIDLENSCSLSDTTSENNSTDFEKFYDTGCIKTEIPEEKKLSLDEVNLDVDRADDFISNDMLKTRNEERAILESYFNDEQPISNDNSTKYHNQYDSQDVRIKAVTPQYNNEYIPKSIAEEESLKDNSLSSEEAPLDTENENNYSTIGDSGIEVTNLTESDISRELCNAEIMNVLQKPRVEKETLKEGTLNLNDLNLYAKRELDSVFREILGEEMEESGIMDSYFEDIENEFPPDDESDQKDKLMHSDDSTALMDASPKESGEEVGRKQMALGLEESYPVEEKTVGTNQHLDKINQSTIPDKAHDLKAPKDKAHVDCAEFYNSDDSSREISMENFDIYNFLHGKESTSENENLASNAFTDEFKAKEALNEKTFDLTEVNCVEKAIDAAVQGILNATKVGCVPSKLFGSPTTIENEVAISDKEHNEIPTKKLDKSKTETPNDIVSQLNKMVNVAELDQMDEKIHKESEYADKVKDSDKSTDVNDNENFPLHNNLNELSQGIGIFNIHDESSCTNGMSDDFNPNALYTQFADFGGRTLTSYRLEEDTSLKNLNLDDLLVGDDGHTEIENFDIDEILNTLPSSSLDHLNSQDKSKVGNSEDASPRAAESVQSPIKSQLFAEELLNEEPEDWETSKALDDYLVSQGFKVKCNSPAAPDISDYSDSSSYELSDFSDDKEGNYSLNDLLNARYKTVNSECFAKEGNKQEISSALCENTSDKEICVNTTSTEMKRLSNAEDSDSLSYASSISEISSFEKMSSESFSAAESVAAINQERESMQVNNVNCEVEGSSHELNEEMQTTAGTPQLPHQQEQEVEAIDNSPECELGLEKQRTAAIEKDAGDTSDSSSSSTSGSSISSQNKSESDNLSITEMKSSANEQGILALFAQNYTANPSEFIEKFNLLDAESDQISSSADRVRPKKSKRIGKKSHHKESMESNESLSASSGTEDSNSDDDINVEAIKIRAQYHDGRDFYEEDRLIDYDNSNLVFAVAPLDKDKLHGYTKLFNAIVDMMEVAPYRFMYEVSTLRYPILAITYLRIIAGSEHQRGKRILESLLWHFDESYTGRIDKLKEIQAPEELTQRARNIISGSEKVKIYMSHNSYRYCLFHMQNWELSQRELLAMHCDLITYKDPDVPKHRPRIGAGTLPTMFYAVPEPPHKKETHRQILRGRRYRRNEPLPPVNEHLPVGDRVFIPIPKRMDLLRLRNDERNCVTLNRNSLPSVYMYSVENSESEKVLCAAFSENDTMLGIGTLSSNIHIYSLTPSKLVQLKSACWLKVLDTGMAGVDKNMLEPETKNTRRTMCGHQGPVYGCVFSPDNRFILSCSDDRTARLWCLLSWTCVVIYPGHMSFVSCISYAPYGYYFATGSNDRTARIWTQDRTQSVHVLSGHLGDVTCCIFHPNTHYLATGSEDCTVRIWDITRAVQIRLLIGHKDVVRCLAFSKCGRFLVSGAFDSYVIVWDTAMERLARCLSHHTAVIKTIEFSMDNNIFLVGGHDGLLSIWDFAAIVKDYEPPKLNHKYWRSFLELGEEPDPNYSLTNDEVFVISYPAKSAVFWKIRVTRRNFVLACSSGIKEPEKVAKEGVTAKKESKYTDWLTHLDIMKLKACFEETAEAKPTQQHQPELSKSSEELNDLEKIFQQYEE
ncbi:uncharacterized protein LOC115622393 [Scaptodrosophila lebanonensis]|uniref:Uncharacterized protein LOC115622393 n=1 Tax=Drosophila lebanonensis TaxID=7225 RepID=A0A6J2TB45_DROLE|nr:uncharacterized protein LOC115622393 [Scaptodrosophila lebanonensis]